MELIWSGLISFRAFGSTSLPSMIKSVFFNVSELSDMFPVGVCSFCLSGSEKVTGIVNFTSTGFPCWVPGFHLGVVFITLKASASNNGFTERFISKLSSEPSAYTTNWTINLP